MSDHTRPVPTDPTPTPSPSRRTVLRTAGMVALAGGGATLAACSSDAQTAAPTPSSGAPSSAPASSAPASSAPASSASAPSSAASSAAAPAGPSVATSEVPVGGGVILEDADYVVTQPTKGQYKAFSKICTHKQCPVTEIAGDNIECKCHGSTFSIKDGSVTNPPANQPLKEFPVTVAGGKVAVTA